MSNEYHSVPTDWQWIAESDPKEIAAFIDQLQADADAAAIRIQHGDRSRDEVLEEAALVCDRITGQFAVEAWEPRGIMSDAAKEIRRLKTKPLN